jgi:putative transposase
VLGQHRSTQRTVPRAADDEQALTEDIIALAKQYGRYGYRRVTALLRSAGWTVNRKRAERIWRREGLKVPQKHPPPAFQPCCAWLEPLQAPPKRGRLWLNDGSCIRLRPEYPGHVWAYDFVEGRTHDGRKFRILTIIDEANRECLALIVARQLRHEDVLAALAEIVCSFVKLKDPKGEMAGVADRLTAAYRLELARYKVPERWYIVDEIPRNAMNKPNRARLLEMPRREVSGV